MVTAAGYDYVAKSPTGQTIAANSPTYTFEVTADGDTFVEPTETFFVTGANVTGRERHRRFRTRGAITTGDVRPAQAVPGAANPSTVQPGGSVLLCRERRPRSRSRQATGISAAGNLTACGWRGIADFL